MYMHACVCVCVCVRPRVNVSKGGREQQGREGRSEKGEMEVIHTNSNTCPRLY